MQNYTIVKKVVIWVLWFPPPSQKHAGKWTGESKLRLGGNECVDVCKVYYYELVIYPGCISTLATSNPRIDSRSLVALSRVNE